MKQIVRVLKAVEKGYATSTEIAALTRLSVKTCSEHLAELVKGGSVEVTGTTLLSGSRRRSNVHIAIR